ncbi:hypothetical protein PUN4_1070043 [Paraburkholderia unamae]|nr:hypothetical protein PUN4_1070043 [Paraburkholderia unamae]
MKLRPTWLAPPAQVGAATFNSNHVGKSLDATDSFIRCRPRSLPLLFRVCRASYSQWPAASDRIGHQGRECTVGGSLWTRGL